MIRHRHILQLEVRHHGRTGAAQTGVVHHGLVRDRGEEADALLLADVQLLALLIDDHMADDRPSCCGMLHACAIRADSLPQASHSVCAVRDRAEHGAGEHERSPLSTGGIRRVLGQIDVTEDQIIRIGRICQTSVGGRVVRLRTISTHAVIPGAGLISVHFRMTYRQRIVIVGGSSIAQGIRIGKIGVTGVFSGRRAIYPVVARESLPGAGLRDLVDTANNLLAGTNRTQLLLVADQDVGLAVDLLGDLTLKVTAAKRRRGDLHIGLRRRLIRRI